ncbi:TraX family protein [Saccharibacillus kuerlensis]|uniref:Membrane protein n=1 Tax=Saccharibacillus kuerlensis TaxID=459527 RepID=A0ABQ2L4I0_9BACL|nr:TraX family protein [Saccharibacillus kuerlensis]GGO02583.1 membrane protein [Saccharibacillus kuerlensis]
MQLIAMITMLIDHLGATFFQNEGWMRIVGRIAFPIYCYLLVVGYKRTRSKPRYAFRLFILALISQLPFMFAFTTTGVNVIATLLVALLIVMAIDYFKGQPWLQWAVGLLLIAATYAPMAMLKFDYATYGVLLVLIYRYMPNAWAMVGGHLVLNILLGNSIQFFSLTTTLLIAIIHSAAPEVRTEVRLPRWLWRAFYPAHLALIALIEWQLYGAGYEYNLAEIFT